MSQATDHSVANEVRSVEGEHFGFPVAEILAALGRAVSGAAALTARAVQAAGPVVARGVRRLAEDCLTVATPPATSIKPLEAHTVAAVDRARNATEILGALSASSAVITLPGQIQPAMTKVKALLATRPQGREALQAARALARLVFSQHTNALAQAVLNRASAAAVAVGFPVEMQKVLPERGYLLARNAAGEILRVDVSRDEERGAVGIARDLDGFRDDRCVQVDKEFEQAMHRLGAGISPARKHRKPRVPLGTPHTSRVRA